jgi:2',3'-cyclic-nucleotide 2'-phosphodiesterase (5'-nucleotidase family)
MKISNPNLYKLSACLLLWFASTTSYAEIYKWVDAEGRTHYSESKEEAGKAKAEAVNVKSASPQNTNASPPSWQEQAMQFNQRQAQKQNQATNKQPVAAPPQSLSGGKTDESDKSKCNLARDVLSGAVEHRNGAKTDSYDREVAQNDIRLFCK